MFPKGVMKSSRDNTPHLMPFSQRYVYRKYRRVSLWITYEHIKSHHQTHIRDRWTNCVM